MKHPTEHSGSPCTGAHNRLNLTIVSQLQCAVGRFRTPEKPGSKYITREGERRLREELDQLWRVERPKVTQAVSEAAAQGDRSENAEYTYGKRRLREIDRRIRYLSKSLDRAVVVDNSGKTHQRVHFGATVTILYESGAEREVTIVGVDELDSGDARISWRSPLARALLTAEVGDRVTLRAPRGPERLEIIAVRYDDLR